MTDILADLAGMQRRPGKVCQIGRLRIDNPEMAEHFDRAVASPYDASNVSRWFSTHGISISDQMVRRHRNDQCESCRTS